MAARTNSGTTTGTAPGAATGAATGATLPRGPHQWERRLLRVLGDCAADRRVAGSARALSWCGEHAAVWLATGLAGAAADQGRRDRWLRGTALVAAAHLASMGVKRVVRRPRPRLEGRAPLVRTAGLHSFPSSHAASAGAAAVAFDALLPGLGIAPLAALTCVSRLVAGVHYPSDVVAGAALGALTARLGAARPGAARPGVCAVRPGARREQGHG